MDVHHWDRVVEEVGPRLYRYFQYKGAGQVSTDLTQETFVRLVHKIQDFDPKQGPLVAYALGLAQNIWWESLRKQKPTENLDEQSAAVSDFDLLEQLEKLDEAQKLRLFVKRLPPVQQDILYFYFDEDITTREIAEVLQMPEGTVKSHLHRAKDAIKEIWQKECL
jgi:RNA polymerase sigma-70 factor (ECF subfamily)